jgi:putative MATE family efflux protein
LMFPWTAISSALRGIGIVRPTVLISVVSIVIDILLAPVLIAGWGTGTAFGVKGAGLAATIASIIGTVLLGAYFCRSQRYLNLQRNLPRPNLRHWLRILNIGLPAGSEFALTFFSSAVVYYVIRNFGTTAQAGFAIGSQILQAIVLPGMSVAFAAGPIAGQNYGAGNSERVKQTFVTAIWIGTALMVAITVFLQSWPHSLVDLFGIDAASTSVAVMFLQLMSWTLVAQGLVYTCSTMFQGFGNTLPSLISAGTRFVVFAVPAVWLSTQPQFRLEQVWYLLILSIVLQALVSAWLLCLEFRKRLPPLLEGAPQRP